MCLQDSQNTKQRVATTKCEAFLKLTTLMIGLLVQQITNISKLTSGDFGDLASSTFEAELDGEAPIAEAGRY